MSKHIELAKKLKELSERGVGGEKVNAEKMLSDLMKKHNLTIEEIEGEKLDNYFFFVPDERYKLFSQIVGRVGYDIKVYGKLKKAQIKRLNLEGDHFVKCTASEYIEIKIMTEHYYKLFDNEFDIFFGAFCMTNDLLVTPPEIKKVADLTPEEREKHRRQKEMAMGIKSETHKRRIETAK